MKLSEPQQTVSDDNSRFRICVAGRRFGKSMLSINELAKFSVMPNQKCLYITGTYRQAKSVIWEELKDRLYAVNWIRKVNESELTITLKNNSKIMIRSAENREALRGIKNNFIVMDECADINPDTWFTVLRPTLSDNLGHALFIGTPKGRGNWFYDLYLKASAETEWATHTYKTIDGGWVDAEEIEQARKDLSEREFKQEYLAEWVDYSGVIYYAFDEANMQSHTYNIQEINTLHIGMDFNRSPMSAVIGIIEKDKLTIIDEVEIYQSNTLEMIQEIKQRYPDKQYICYPDASGSARSTNSNLSDHLILANNGFTVRAGKTNPPVLDRFNAVNSMLCNAKGERKLVIDPQCRKVRECLIKMSYKENTRIPDKDSGYDHMSDALGYLVYQNFGIRKDVSKGIGARRRTL